MQIEAKLGWRALWHFTIKVERPSVSVGPFPAHDATQMLSQESSERVYPVSSIQFLWCLGHSLRSSGLLSEETPDGKYSEFIISKNTSITPPGPDNPEVEIAVGTPACLTHH